MIMFLFGAISAFVIAVIIFSVAEAIEVIAMLQAVGSIAIAISAIVAINLYRTTVRRNAEIDKQSKSKEYLNQAVLAMERAYSVFTDDGNNINPPRNDRAIWLTTARCLIRFKRLKPLITEEEHNTSLREEEEYWRTTFRTLLHENKTNFDLDYFMPTKHQYAPGVVHRDSIGVIFYFAKWPDDSDDPMDDTDVIEMYARGAIPIDFFGVEDYLDKYLPYKAKINERKAEIEKCNKK